MKIVKVQAINCDDMGKKKRQVCCQLDISFVEKLEKIREEIGISVGKQLELMIKGYEIRKIKN
jgi:hypothetical protein